MERQQQSVRDARHPRLFVIDDEPSIRAAINRFLADFGHEAGTAILPLFLTAIGAPAMALGAIEGVADGLSSFAKLFGGWLGDKVERRRPWAAAGYLITGVTTGLYGLFSAWPWTLVRNWSTTSLWHMPQVSGTPLRNAWDFGGSSFTGSASFAA